MLRKIRDRLNVSYNKITQFFEKSPIARYAAVFGFFFLSFCWMYFSITLLSSSDDHYFHFRFAQQMVEHGFFESFKNFHAIAFSKMATDGYFVYYNFLFYLVILPFTFITPLYLGIKLYAVFAVTLACVIVYAALRQLHIRAAFLWTIGFIAIIGGNSLWRFFLSRPYTLAPALLLLLIIALYKKKYGWAAAIAGVYFFWHSLTFYFPLLVATVYFIAEHLHTKKNRYPILWWVLGGTLVALGLAALINPGFFHYFNDVVISNYRETILGKKVLIQEGGELYPVSFFDFVRQNIFLFVLFVIATSVQISVFFKERINGIASELHGAIVPRLTFFLLAISFFAGTVVISKRFSDFFVFFGWIFVVLVTTEVFSHIQVFSSIIKRALVVGILVVLGYLFVNAQLDIQGAITSGGSAPEEFEKVSAWITTNTQPGDVIFTPTWNWFPQLYYFNPDRRYIIGLEPRFLYAYDPALYWKWWNISTNGYVCTTEHCSGQDAAFGLAKTKNSPEQKQWQKTQGDAIAASITRDFQSHFILTQQGSSWFNDILDNNSHFKKVYGGETKRYAVYQVSE